MSLLNYFRSQKKTNASLAKERLQIIVAHERQNRISPDYLPAMKKDILEVIAKYVKISEEDVSVEFDHGDELTVLELNVTLPDELR